jgi:chemotaxis protein CheX
MVSTEILNAFYATTIVVFEQEVKERLRRTDLKLDQVKRTADDIAALIAVTGEIEGMVVLEMSRGTAKHVASTMAGYSMLMYDPLVDSAIGELANMIVGRATGELESLNLHCDIAPPAVISGKGVEISSFGIPAVTALLVGENSQVTLRIALRHRGAPSAS